MRNRYAAIGSLAAFALMLAVPASAQVVHSVSFGGGFFTPRGLDSRVDGDVLVRNKIGEQILEFPTLTDALAFDIGDFRSGTVFAEWNIGIGNHVEIGAGVAAFGRSVPTLYVDLVDEFDREIEQTLKLRVVPITGVVRFMPFGRAGDVQPYVGAGVGLLSYRYSEFGRFVDGDTLDIFEDRYTATGTAPAAVLLGGVRLPIGGDVYGLSLEGRYLMGSGNTGGFDEGFLDEKIDLSGLLFNVGFQVRF